MLNFGSGLNLHSGGGPAQLPTALAQQLEVLLEKNRRRAQERSCHHDHHGGNKELETIEEQREQETMDALNNATMLDDVQQPLMSPGCVDRCAVRLGWRAQRG